MLAERLGFAADERIAIVHADDIGMCHAVNQGCFEALREGPVTCGSVMVPCPWFREAVELARAEPDFDIGVHLTLNSEFEHYRWGPVAGREAVPSLVDDEGYLWRSTLEVVRNARPEEVEIELRAQIQMALDAGLDVTHIDGHMGTVFLPPLAAVYRKLARDFGVVPFAAHPDEAMLEAVGLLGAAPTLRALAEEIEAEGYPVLDAFDGDSLGFAPADGLAHNRRRLARLPRGVTYVICHPGRGGEELERVTPEQAAQREFERTFYGGASGRQAFAEEGIRTIGMRPLRDLMRSG